MPAEFVAQVIYDLIIEMIWSWSYMGWALLFSSEAREKYRRRSNSQRKWWRGFDIFMMAFTMCLELFFVFWVWDKFFNGGSRFLSF